MILKLNKWKNCEHDFINRTTPTIQNGNLLFPNIKEFIITVFPSSLAKNIIRPIQNANKTAIAISGVVRTFVRVKDIVGIF